MSREIDTRDTTIVNLTAARRNQLHAAEATVSSQLPDDHQVRITEFNPLTGNASAVVSDNAPRTDQDYIQRALSHIQSIGPVIGLSAQHVSDFQPAPLVPETSSGAHVVHVQQQYKGIPVFQASLTVRFDPSGRIADTVGTVVTLREDLAVDPKLSVEQAVIVAATHVATPTADEQTAKDQFGQPLNPARVDIAGYAPTVRGAGSGTPERVTVLDGGPFGSDIVANLVWFDRGDKLILAWEVLITFPHHEAQYMTLVDADAGEILYCHQLVQSISGNVCNVYTVNAASARQLMFMPDDPWTTTQQYGIVLPSGQAWRRCANCQTLYNSSVGGGVCPANKQAHSPAAGRTYRIIDHYMYNPWDSFWSQCLSCHALFYQTTPGVCPAGGGHLLGGAFSLMQPNFSSWTMGEGGWNKCNKCGVLYYTGAQGICAAGGQHDFGIPAGVTVETRGADFPDDAGSTSWITSTATTGNCAAAHMDGAAPVSATGSTQGFYQFNPSDPVGNDQKVVNAFYFNGFLHDIFYLLGFTEKAGNFQADNFGRGGIANDPVDVRVYAGAVSGTASMLTPVDGQAPTMSLGLLAQTNRHTAFDSTVVFHEFMHGVTNRLVGGPNTGGTLVQPQSAAMGEGWGDYVACTLNNVTVVGSWVSDKPAGLRGYPYDANFPDNFGSLGTGRYTEVHNCGEIWCATLMEMNRRTDRSVALQLVVDALKLSPANPNFLQVRDAILLALDNMLTASQVSAAIKTAARTGIWGAFAKFGMGPNAQCTGSTLTGIVTDFSVPTS